MQNIQDPPLPSVFTILDWNVGAVNLTLREGVGLSGAQLQRVTRRLDAQWTRAQMGGRLAAQLHVGRKYTLQLEGFSARWCVDFSGFQYAGGMAGGWYSWMGASALEKGSEPWDLLFAVHTTPHVYSCACVAGFGGPV